MKIMNISLSSMFIFHWFVEPEGTPQSMFLIMKLLTWWRKQAFFFFLAFISLEVRSNFFQMFVIIMERRKSSVKENKTNLNFTCHCFKTISTTAMFFMKAVNSILALLQSLKPQAKCMQNMMKLCCETVWQDCKDTLGTLLPLFYNFYPLFHPPSSISTGKLRRIKKNICYQYWPKFSGRSYKIKRYFWGRI